MQTPTNMTTISSKRGEGFRGVHSKISNARKNRRTESMEGKPVRASLAFKTTGFDAIRTTMNRHNGYHITL